MIGVICQDSLTLGGELGAVGGDRVTAAFVIGLEGGVLVFEDDRGVFHTRSPELVGQVQLGGGPALDTDVRARKRFETGGRIADNIGLGHDRLPIVEIDRAEGEAKLDIAGPGPRAVAGENVHLAGLQRRKALLCAQAAEFNGVGIIEERGRPGTAEINIESGPVTVGIDETKALEGPVHTADQAASIQYGLQAFTTGDRRSRRGGCWLGFPARRFATTGRCLSGNNAGDLYCDWCPGDRGATGGKYDAGGNDQT